MTEKDIVRQVNSRSTWYDAPPAMYSFCKLENLLISVFPFHHIKKEKKGELFAQTCSADDIFYIFI